MSSLRLALKQSLQETGHLVPKDKKKKKKRGLPGRNKDKPARDASQSSSRKRGRPPKRLSRTEAAADDNNNEGEPTTATTKAAEKRPSVEKADKQEGEENEADFSSENEFSYDSDDDSEEEDDSEEDDSEEEEEDDDDNEEGKVDDAGESQGKQMDDPRGNNGETIATTPQDTTDSSATKHRSSPKEEEEEEADSEDERRRHRKLLKKKAKNLAANKIQSQWKKKRKSHNSSKTAKDTSKPPKEDEDGQTETTKRGTFTSNGKSTDSDTKEAEASDERKGNKPESADANEAEAATTNTVTVEKKKRKPGTVPAPSQEILEWSERLTEKKSRKNICKGMRVKVRFATKVRKEGKIVKKRKWYGGRVSNVTPDGSKIKIKYDDGTSEISQFPDDDVVVDDTDNGQHSQAASASVHRFVPRQARSPTPTPSATIVVAGVEEKEEVGELAESKEEKAVETKEKEEEKEVEEAPKATESSNTKEEEEKVVESIPTEKLQKENEPQEDNKEGEEVEKPKPMDEEDGDTKMEEAPETKPPAPVLEESKPAPEETTAIAEVEEMPRSSPKPSPETTVDTAAAKTEKESPAEPMDTDEPTPKEDPKPEASSSEEAVPPKTKQQEEKLAKPSPEPKEPETKPSKPTLTIRISKAKVQENDEKQPKTPKQHKRSNSNHSSDEELDAETPVTERKVKSLKIKRKRVSDESSPGGSRPKKRKPAAEMEETPKKKTEEKKTALTEKAKELPVKKSPKKSSTALTIHIKQPQVDVDEEIPQLPSLSGKAKKRKDSPIPRGGRRKSPTPTPPSNDSPQPMSQDIGKDRNETTTMVKPVSKKAVKADGVDSADLEISNDDKAPKAALGSKGSAFGKKSKAYSANDSSIAAATEEGLPTKSKDSDNAPKVGRKAAQEAKEKMGPKQQEDKELGAANKKKKKRRRKDGSDEDESEDDERQWVQCDECKKWRVLPSRMEALSLPEVWRCTMNHWDPERADCTASEQTLKQVQKERRREKERRRAKKRAKQQRLEQAVLDAKEAESNPEPKARGVKSAQSSPRPTKPAVKAAKTADVESKRASPVPLGGNNSESGPDSKAEKRGRKAKKEKDESKQVKVDKEILPGEVTPKKPGRKRGRPARNVPTESPRSTTKDDDNVEWVQCEKCEKWRKLPPYMAADELPDKWYCSLNTWNEASASCDAAEDKADAHHQEVGVFGNMPQGHVGKYSYRSMIYGSGRKYNRPMSEKARAAESLFQRPQVEEGIPQTSVMYAKSSMFVPRMSNFQKTQVVEKKTATILDALADSDLWAELQGVGHAMKVLSNNFSGDQQPGLVTYDSLPEIIKEHMRGVVLQVLGVYVLSGDELVDEALRFPWESLSAHLTQIRAYINADIVINTLLALVRDGEVEMTCFKDMSVPMTEWVPRYRRVIRSSPKNLENHGSLKTSKCMKISKPWKQMDDSEGWITGGQ
ncbi:MAG: hypothetical protein SGBAC_003576 [Bacillariaceae sp.]